MRLSVQEKRNIDIQLWSDDEIKIDPEKFFFQVSNISECQHNNLSGNPRFVIYYALLFFYFAGIVQIIRSHIIIILVNLLKIFSG